MISSNPQVSAPGLTEEQLCDEQAWLNEFSRAADSLDWSRCERFWSNDAFLQFGNEPKLTGKPAIADYFTGQMPLLEAMDRKITRYSFDVPGGLIYQTVLASYRVKGDPASRTIEVPGVAVIHKKVGDHTITGFEVYIDKGPVAAVIKEVLQGEEGTWH